MQTRVVIETGFRWQKAVNRAAAWINHYGKDGFGLKTIEVSRPPHGFFSFLPGRIIILAVLTNPPPADDVPMGEQEAEG